MILSRLARNPQRIVSSEEIWQHAWSPASPFNAESLHVHIYRLRRRLSPFRIHIETMVGYKLMTIAECGMRNADYSIAECGMRIRKSRQLFSIRNPHSAFRN